MQSVLSTNVLQRHFCVSSGKLLRLMYCADIKVPLMKQNKSFCNDFQMSFCQSWLDLSFKLKQKGSSAYGTHICAYIGTDCPLSKYVILIIRAHFRRSVAAWCNFTLVCWVCNPHCDVVGVAFNPAIPYVVISPCHPTVYITLHSYIFL